MLDVTFDELPGRRMEDMRAWNAGCGGDQRQAVLQLIAEAKGAARLVEGGASPDSAGQRLIEQPPVQQEVHRAVRRFYRDRAEDVIPEPARFV